MPRTASPAADWTPPSTIPPCPHCDGPLRAHRLPTQDEWNEAYPGLAGYDRDHPETPLPAGSDTLNPKLRAALGGLYTCTVCGASLRLGGSPED
jgi:hypothetical protein